uniref:Sulfotransferase n=1 Tax=Panagrolaimus sp. ES5 TaxID=591445 RepID=A0AC34FKL1_9BILA
MWHSRFCWDKNEYIQVQNILDSANTTLEEWQLFAIVRDPFERFLSGFVHLCVIDKYDCYKCKSDNLTCFLENAYQQAINYANGKNIIEYHVDGHIFPQNWYVIEGKNEYKGF